MILRWEQVKEEVDEAEQHAEEARNDRKETEGAHTLVCKRPRRLLERLHHLVAARGYARHGCRGQVHRAKDGHLPHEVHGKRYTRADQNRVHDAACSSEVAEHAWNDVVKRQRHHHNRKAADGAAPVHAHQQVRPNAARGDGDERDVARHGKEEADGIHDVGGLRARIHESSEECREGGAARCANPNRLALRNRNDAGQRRGELAAERRAAVACDGGNHAAAQRGTLRNIRRQSRHVDEEVQCGADELHRSSKSLERHGGHIRLWAEPQAHLEQQ
mmetsp:Transcript_9977/g.26716  ORF Transcript_9977/g.26716 Transcript_9977/m.26716 type:complete len:275 (-) Transcript_9977:1531-2355(-)